MPTRSAPPPATKGFPRFELAAVLLLLGLFLALTLYRQPSPAMVYDAIDREYDSAVMAEQLHEGTPLGYLLGRKGFPLYHGMTLQYVLLPVFYLAGSAYWVLRLWPVAFALTGLVFFYAFARETFGGKTALLALFLLVVHPPFFVSVRIGSFATADMFLFTALALFALQRLWRTRRPHYGFIAVAALFLGAGTRFWYFWLPAGLVLTAALFAKDVLRWLAAWKSRPRLILAAGSAAVAALFIGLILATLVKSDFELFRRIATFTSYDGKELSFQSLLHSLNQFRRYFSGTIPFYFVFGWWSGGDKLYAYAVLAGAAGCAANALPAFRAYPYRKRTLAALGLLLSIVGLIILTPKRHAPGSHFFLLHPFPTLALAAGAASWAWLLRRRRRGALAVILCAGLAALSQLRTTARFMGSLHKYGGMGYGSDRLLDLDRWLDESAPAGEEVIMSQFVYQHLYFLKTPIKPLMFPVGLLRETVPDFLERTAAERRNVRVVAFLHGAEMQTMSLIGDWAKKKGASYEPEKTFSDPDGEPAYVVYRLVLPGKP